MTGIVEEISNQRDCASRVVKQIDPAPGYPTGACPIFIAKS